MATHHCSVSCALRILVGLMWGCLINDVCRAEPPVVENYPVKTITVVCPWSAGGGTDALSRHIGDQLHQRLNTPVIVVNKTGGSGAIGHEAIAEAKPNGYTIGMITAELSTMHNMGICDRTYRDYKCLMQLNADAAALIVRKDAPWKTLPEFLEEVKRRPGELKMSGTATGGLWDLARAGMLDAAGFEVNSVIWVPTKGSAPSVVQLLGGHIDAVCCSVPEVASQVEAGELRVLAVFSEEPLPDFPNLPTAKEQKLDWVAMGWRGLALPQETPPSIVELLEYHLKEIVASDEYHTFMKKQGFGVAIKGPKEFETFLDQQETQWKGVLEAAGYIQNDDQEAHLGANDPGPYSLPIALGVVLCLGGLSQLGFWWFSRKASIPSTNDEPAEDESEANSRNWNVVILVGLLLAYLVLMPVLGFQWDTVFFATGLIWWLGSRWWVGLFSAVLLTIVVQVLFVWVFHITLPESGLGLPDILPDSFSQSSPSKDQDSKRE